MGFLEDRRRRAHGQSANWEMLAAIMLMAFEMDKAEREGISDNDEQAQRAMDVRDAVLDEVGGAQFTQALIDADYELRSRDKDAELEDALERAVDASGYLSARKRLFPS